MQPRREGYSEEWGNIQHSFNILCRPIKCRQKRIKQYPTVSLRTGQMMRGCYKWKLPSRHSHVTNDRGLSVRIAIIGTGYVGLVSGACFADFGHHVTCVDSDADKIAALQRGEIPIFEPDLEHVVASNVQQGRLSFASDVADAVGGADTVLIAVGTPTRRGDGYADLSYVYAAAGEIAAALDGFHRCCH